MSSSTAVRNPFSGVKKAAIVLLSLGPAASANVLKKLSEEQVAAIGSAMARLGTVAPHDVEAVLEEFKKAAEERTIDIKGGIEHVRAILTDAFGRDYATRVLDRVEKSLDHEAVDFGSLNKVDPQQLAKFIQEEHPQTIALVLSHLDPSQAAELIRALPADSRADVLIRMAGLEQIPPESVRTIAAVIGQKLRNLGELSREAYGGVRAVANLLNRLDPNNCTQLLDAMEQVNPGLFENIRRLMFVFEDLEKLDDAAIRQLVAKVDRKILVTAFKGTSEGLQKHFMKAFSERATEMMREDLEALGPVKIKEVDAAQQQIISVARQLESEGVISLRNSAAEQYV